MASHRFPLLAAALTAGLLLAACGGDDAADDAVDVATEAVGTDESAEPTSTELPEPAPGPAPELEVATESVDSQLPEVAVRQLNGEGGWVQFKNELPSEQPLLVWFWAPF